MSAPSAPPNNPPTTLDFPKRVRLLRPSEFRKVYDHGDRFTCALFSAFTIRGQNEPRFGFTLPRAVGKSVVRNRIRRRLRELVRLSRHRFPADSWTVFNPRRAAEEAPLERLRADLERLIGRLSKMTELP
jgi:ribonuclease P protein component